jgi:hypothetical protein
MAKAVKRRSCIVLREMKASSSVDPIGKDEWCIVLVHHPVLPLKLKVMFS